MKKLIIGFLVIGLILASSCTPAYVPPANNLPANTPSNDNGIALPIRSTVVLPGEPPTDRTWISPGKVEVGNFYPGARAEWNLLVHNGNDVSSSFAVTYRYPDHVGEAYAKPTNEVQDWVIIADAMPVLMPRETRNIMVVLAMPEEATIFTPKWEFWISVKDITQTGMVQTELCSRWLVTMSNEI